MRSALQIYSGLAVALLRNSRAQLSPARRTPAAALALCGLLTISLTAVAQTNYGLEAARNPGAASKPTPRLSDGHPDLNGVWHHFFGIGTIEKVNGNFVIGGAFVAKPGVSVL